MTVCPAARSGLVQSHRSLGYVVLDKNRELIPDHQFDLLVLISGVVPVA
jgi:hypothetical protein